MTEEYYILDENRNPKLVDRETRIRWLGGDARSASKSQFVADEQIGDVRVATIFTGVPGKLFETAVFGGKHDTRYWKSNTWEDAKARHVKAIALVKGSLEDDFL